MILRFSRSKNELVIEDTYTAYVATNDVRNELNGRRRLHDPKEVVKTVVNGKWGPPYMPRQFPLGTWNVLRVEEQPRDSGFWPVKIVTDAHQPVKVWKLDKNGGYEAETDEVVEDSGYHLHWTPFNTTHGCIRVGGPYTDEVVEVAMYVKRALQGGHKVQLIVEE